MYLWEDTCKVSSIGIMSDHAVALDSSESVGKRGECASITSTGEIQKMSQSRTTVLRFPPELWMDSRRCE